MKTLALPALLCLTLSACATGGPSAQALDDALTAAQQEIARADQAGFLWRDTEKLLKDAYALKNEGKVDEAMALAKKALNEAREAQHQAAAAASAAPQYTH